MITALDSGSVLKGMANYFKDHYYLSLSPLQSKRPQVDHTIFHRQVSPCIWFSWLSCPNKIAMCGDTLTCYHCSWSVEKGKAYLGVLQSIKKATLVLYSRSHSGISNDACVSFWITVFCSLEEYKNNLRLIWTAVNLFLICYTSEYELESGVILLKQVVKEPHWSIGYPCPYDT